MKVWAMRAVTLGAVVASAAGVALAAGGGQGQGFRTGGGATEMRGAADAGDRIGAAIDRAIKAGGPFFADEERRLIEAKCGYAPGSWDGQNFSMTNGSFRCRDGKSVDDAEMRAMLANAEPRIEKRMKAAMESPEVKAAFEALHRQVEAETKRALAEARVAERAAAEAAQSVERAMAESRRAIEESRRAIEQARPARR